MSRSSSFPGNLGSQRLPSGKRTLALGRAPPERGAWRHEEAEPGVELVVVLLVLEEEARILEAGPVALDLDCAFALAHAFSSGFIFRTRFHVGSFASWSARPSSSSFATLGSSSSKPRTKRTCV
jgi:hypothetical protein